MNEQIKTTLLDMLSPERLARIDTVLENRTSNLTILLDRIHHPHNIAAVMRSADAFGVKTVHVIEASNNQGKSLSEAQKSPGISLGTEKWIEVVKHPSGLEAIKTLKKEGYTIVTFAPPPIGESSTSDTTNSTENSLNSICVTELPFEKKLCLLFGSEVEGVHPELQAESDLKSYIPMYGFVESFNISVACAITLFCSILGKTSPERRTAHLNETEREILREDWIKKSIPRSDEIIQHLSKRNEETSINAKSK